MVNRVYAVGMLSSPAGGQALLGGLWQELPGLNPVNTTSMSVMFLVPFNAAVAVQVYNRANDVFELVWSTVRVSGFFILSNLVGYAAGLATWSMASRDESTCRSCAASTMRRTSMSVVNLMLIFYLRDFTESRCRRPARAQRCSW